MLKCGVACSQVLISTSKMSVQVHDQSMVSHVLMEAGRFARCPVRPESFRWTESRFARSMKVVSPESFSTGSKNKEKQIKFKIFSDQSNDESDTNKQAKKLSEYSSF